MRNRTLIAITIAAYLAAVVAGNLVINEYGKDAVLYVAFGLIGFVLVARDLLHSLFGEGRIWKMGLLIGTGALLTYFVNVDAEKIAIASVVAFAVSETVDYIVYAGLRDQDWYERVNMSNVVSATVDTVIFFQLAFGDVPFALAFAQICAKIAGGFLFSYLAARRALLARHA